MKLIPLSPSDNKFQFATHKVVLLSTDITGFGAGTTGTVQILPTSGTFPAGSTVRFSGLYLPTPFTFSDGSINSLLVEIGDGTVTNRHLTQTQIASAGTPVTQKAANSAYAYTAADSIKALFTVAGGASPTLGEATAGEVHILLHITDTSMMTRAKGPLS